ncbi:unnamed protein product [Plutella xylostella]|uniref:(diamondback moth) hypothetical protein n=1 Tax=Plutella xylostella TaxID=51655 RepID=A0A8S4D230_PLUXY|nr:unnamed protein product [Plutella xylostella]
MWKPLLRPLPHEVRNDLKLFAPISCQDDQIRFQQDINNVEEWSRENKLSFNGSKCCVITFSRSKNPVQHQYTLGGSPMERVTSVRDLGVRMTSDLSFKEHITGVCKQAFKTLGFVLRTVRGFKNITAIKALFNALVRSKLEFNAVVWAPSEVKYSSMIDKIQNKFIRFLYMKLYGVYPGYPLLYPTLFVLGMVGYNRLEVRRDLALTSYLFRIWRGKTGNPSILQQLRLTVPSNSLRSRKSRTFAAPCGRTALLRQAPVTRAIHLLNRIDDRTDIHHCPLSEFTKVALFRKLYIEWSNGEPLLGVNPNMPSSVPGCPTLEAERIGLGERVAALGYAPVIQEYLKKGSPQCLRAKLWSQVLGAEVLTQKDNFFIKLKKSVLEVDLMIDKLIFKDVQLTASNDDQYFVFEDLLYQVMLCFSRDSEVRMLLKDGIGTPLTVTIKGRQTSPDSVTVFPPSGVIPFHGFTMYATPFCYLYDDPVQLYYTFRAFYIRYWHRLHYISTHPQGIVSLCLLYERLLEANEPLLWIHFRNININPIRVVFKWLMRAFSGHLPPDQLLLLWDAILGYDSLEILPLLALAILSFRKENIFQVNTLQNVDAVLADLSTVSVIPLLQLSLMKS